MLTSHQGRRMDPTISKYRIGIKSQRRIEFLRLANVRRLSREQGRDLRYHRTVN